MDGRHFGNIFQRLRRSHAMGGVNMDRKPVVNIGEQRFYKLIEENRFYIDKTDFIREWWENGSTVTLITRPRRFGKT